MIDHFALLGEPRRPWIDPEALKEKFLALSTQTHPDKVRTQSNAEDQAANQRFAELNAAYNCLREPRSRLLHLLELETGAKPKEVQRIPPGTMDLFVEIGQACRDADQLLEQSRKITSPLGKVRSFEQGQVWTEKLTALQSKINVRAAELQAELTRLNSLWAAAPDSDPAARRAGLPLDRLEEIYRILSYIARWTEQIQERIVQLAF